MSNIKQLDDLKDFATYKLDLAKSLAKVGKVPAPIVFVKKFQFTTKAVPMALVGPLDTKFKAALVAQKIPMKLGKCVRRDDGKIVLDALNAIEVNAAFEAAAVKDQIDPNGDFDKAGLGAVANLLDKHLQDSGRATGDEGKRDQMSGKILQGMEKATNERNKLLDPSKPESHHVSAHGPGTDQVTRLVAGRRPDEVQDETAKGKTPTKTVKLTGNKHGVPDQEVPVYDKTGQNTSNRSGAFSSNTAMLHAIEEAYAQASQLDGYLGKIMTEAFKDNNKKVMEKTEVSEAFGKVQNARKAAQLVAAQLKKGGLPHTQVLQLKQQVETLTTKANTLADEFEQVFKANGGDKLVRPDDMNVGGGRLVRTVDPKTGEGFLPKGLGTGLEAVGVDKQKKGDKIATTTKSTEKVMQERFENIKPVGNQTTARVVMDPAYVKDEKGNVRRAGWDMQTAFPQEGPGQDSFSDPKVAKKFVEANKAIKTIELQLVEINKAHVKLNVVAKNAQKNVEKQNTSIDYKIKTLMPQYELAVTNATDESGKTAAELKLEKLKTEIESLKLKLPPLLIAETKAVSEFTTVDEKKTELELKLKKLQEVVGGDTE
jgi:hypothetical protein